MDDRSCDAEPPTDVASPYRHFTRDEWAQLRADTELTLTIDDLRKLQSTHDPISLDEVIAIYLPLSRLLALYVAATQGLFKATQRFLGADDGKVPYIIGVAGSVAVGKSTTARVLQALLTRWPNTPKVELVTTDGFLHPNARAHSRRPDGAQGLSRELRRHGADPLPRRGQGGRAQRRRAGLFAPHLRRRARRADRRRPARHPDRRGPQRAAAQPPVARGQRRSRSSPTSSTSRCSSTPATSCWRNGTSSASCACATPRSAIRAAISANTPISTTREAEATARSIWRRINLVNLHENILPTRPRASLRLTKGAEPPHRGSRVAQAVSEPMTPSLSARASPPRFAALFARLALAAPAVAEDAAAPPPCVGRDLGRRRRLRRRRGAHAPTISSTRRACSGASSATASRRPICSARSIRPTTAPSRSRARRPNSSPPPRSSPPSSAAPSTPSTRRAGRRRCSPRRSRATRTRSRRR